MRSAPIGVVDIVREFLLAHRLLRRLFDRHRSGTLRFEDVQALAGDTEASVLFRLKERCHALFRAGDVGDDLSRVALFDLAVGSLFHEAMKLRENFYQLEVYAPKVEAAQRDAESGTEGLFEEFARILAASRARLAEALIETEALLEQTRKQFRVLLRTQRRNGLVARYLLENVELAGEVLGEPLDVFLTDVHGDAVTAYALAARSYLESGYFDESTRVLGEALARDPARNDLRDALAYADGMSAYLRADYSRSLRNLEQWTDGALGVADPAFRNLAWSAVTRVAMISAGAGQPELADRASALAQRLSVPA